MKKPRKLSDLELHFQDVLDALSSNIAILDENGVILAVNQAWRSFSLKNGLTLPDDGIGANYLDVCDTAVGVDAETAVQVAAAIRKIQGGLISEAIFEYPCHAPQEQRWFQVRISKFMLGKNFIIVIHDNITKRKDAEESLRESERKFRSIAEQSSEGLSLVDSSGKIIEWNASEEKITGLSRDSVLGRNLWDVQEEISANPAKAEIKLQMEKLTMELLRTGEIPAMGKPYETEIVRPDGTHLIILNSFFSIKHNHGFMACNISRDITDLIKTRSELTVSENKFRSYFNSSPIIAFILSREGDFIEVNPEACEALGYSNQEFLRMNMIDLVPPGEEDHSDRLYAELLETGRGSAEISIRCKDGKILTVSSNAVALPGGSLMVMCTDLSDFKRAQIELQESEAFLKNILDNIPSLITVKETEKLTYFKINKPMEDYLQKTNQEVIGKTAHDIFIPEEAAFFSEQDKLAIQQKKIITIPKEELTTRGSHKQILQEKKVPILDERGNPKFILSIAEDITDRINLEIESNLHLARLEAISQLSTGLQTIQTLDELYPTLLEMILQIIHAPMGCIWIFNNDKNELVPVHHLGGGEDNEILISRPLQSGMGIFGFVYQSQKPYVSRNYVSDPHLSDYKRDKLSKELGGITLPLRTANSIIGVINISVYSDRIITEEDVKLLTTLSEIAGNAIQNITLKEQTEQRLMHISAISSIDRAITSSFDIQVSLEILVSNVINQLEVDASAVMLFNPHSKLLEYSTGQGFHSNAAETLVLRLGESFAGKVALNQEYIGITNLAETENKLFADIQMKEGFAAYFGVPLIAKGQLKGVLEVFKRTPYEPDNDWINFLKSLAEQASIAIDNMQMFENLQRSNTELSLAYNATIEGWSRALDLRDKETEGHTLRVTEITERLAWAFHFTDDELKYIRWGALLHDIGKLGVPDDILLKPGSLTEEEWKIMRMHPTYAYEMLSPISYLSKAMDIPYCHHEKWDGSGYPRGLSGEKIPLAARIFAVVDIWDALRSDRPYRKAWPEKKVIDHLRSLSGTHLDPKVVDFCLNSGIFTSEGTKGS